MSKIKKDQIIEAFSQLGNQLQRPDEQLWHIIETEQHHNAWFTPENTTNAITAIAESLNKTDITIWLSKYPENENAAAKKIGLILAGNIPLVGLHDVLCVLATGNHALIKASSQDSHLIKYVLQKLVEIDSNFAVQYSFVERLENFDAVIATGSNN